MKLKFVVWGIEERSVPCVCSMKFITERTTHLLQLIVLPNQELSGAKSELQRETVGLLHLIKGAANHPIISP